MKIIRNKYIPFPGFKAVNIFGVLFVRKSARIDNVLIRHEKIHTSQMFEVTVVSLILFLLFMYVSWWLPLLSPFVYYVWYGVEWLIRFIRLRNAHEAYRNISFEKEAYSNQDVDYYLGKRKFFNFLNHLK